jgi:hypothetical protein
MDPSQADIKRQDPVLDGCWLPAVVADVLLGAGQDTVRGTI